MRISMCLIKICGNGGRHYGQLPWEDVLSPAIKLAENGFPCDSYLVSQIEDMLPEIRYFNITDKFLPLGILPSAGGKKLEGWGLINRSVNKSCACADSSINIAKW
jgi:hypothetical protein